LHRWAAVLLILVGVILGAGCSGSVSAVKGTPPVSPSIAAQPSNQSVMVGQTAFFSVAATGTAPLSYQWEKNGAAISGATSSSYTMSATVRSDNGAQFTAVVSNAGGSVASSAAALTVNVAPLLMPATQLPAGTLTYTYDIPLTASGGLTPYVWTLSSGALPNGLALGVDGLISGTPMLAGSYPFVAQVTDAEGSSVTGNFSINVLTPPPGSADCTLFAFPSANDGNSGTSPSAPKSFFGAASATQPGSVLCLLGGSYNLSSSFTPPNSGSPSAWIVYKNYGDGPVNFVYTGSANANSIFRITNGGSFPSGGPAYLEFRGLNLNGQGNSGDAFWCGGTHHLRFISNTMHDTGGSGIATRDCDYLTADHNLVFHNGYLPSSTSVPQWYGWTSGISFNSNQWFDNYSGFHNIISNNIVVGEFDSSSNHTDGNGIILDLSSGSYDPATANTPPALIINNVVYGNGGRCILGYVVTNFWFVNNTCFKNDLDTLENNFGSFQASNSHDGYMINNIAVAIGSNHPSFEQSGPVSNLHYFQNLSFGSSPNFSPSDPSQFIQADPLFLSPPSLSLNSYSSALVPSLLGNGLTLLPLSPAFSKGIDPSTLSGLSANLVTDLKKYIYTDINGKTRPQGGGLDLGAYQH
jgi:hypothetical protein